MTPDLDLLRPALEMAIVVARMGESAPVRIDAPRSLRPFLKFAKAVPQSLAAARAALDTDELFRSRVTAAVDQEEVGPAGWLFLSRPEGWQEQFDAYVVARRSEDELAGEQAQERELAEARSRIAALESDLSALGVERDGALVRAVAAEGAVAELQANLEAALAQVDAAVEDRTRAVRELSTMKALHARRTEELHEARAALRDAGDRIPTDPAEPPRPAPVDRDALLGVIDALRSGWQELGELVGGAEQLLRPPDGETAPSQVPAVATTSRPAAPIRRPRRTPVRLEQALVEGTIEAARWLLARPGAQVLVDGYNVTLLVWPDLALAEQRTALERAVARIQMRYPIDVVVVFDGDDAERTTARSDWCPRAGLVFTDVDTEADDEILSLVEQSRHGVVIVVSNDRRVRDGARSRGANVIGSSEFRALII